MADHSPEGYIDAFRLFLGAVGGPPQTGLVVKDKAKVLAALDILDPELAERLTAAWGERP